MRRRLQCPDQPDGQSIIPDGPPATQHDASEFKRFCIEAGFSVEFAGPGQKIATSPLKKLVRIPKCTTTGLLTDEYLHVWNNCGHRGEYLGAAGRKQEHLAFASTLRLSGSTNDRQFHKLELENFILWIEGGGGPIPVFVWRTFI